jgi:hypothetical protein
MVAVPHTDEAGAVCRGQGQRLVHRARADDRAEAIAAREQGRRTGPGRNANIRPRVDDAFLDSAGVNGQPNEAMRIDSAQLRFQQAAGCLARVIGRHIEALQHAAGVLEEVEMMVAKGFHSSHSNGRARHV